MFTWNMIESGRKVSETLKDFLCCEELEKKETGISGRITEQQNGKRDRFDLISKTKQN